MSSFPEVKCHYYMCWISIYSPIRINYCIASIINGQPIQPLELTTEPLQNNLYEIKLIKCFAWQFTSNLLIAVFNINAKICESLLLDKVYNVEISMLSFGDTIQMYNDVRTICSSSVMLNISEIQSFVALHQLLVDLVHSDYVLRHPNYSTHVLFNNIHLH
eukprot:361897_1